MLIFISHRFLWCFLSQQYGEKLADKLCNWFYLQAKKKGQDLDNLKQELETDDHKIPLEDLCRRLHTNPDTVRTILMRVKAMHVNYLMDEVRSNVHFYDYSQFRV